MGAGEEIRDQDGSIILGPADDELIPPVPHGTLLAPTPFPLLDPAWRKERRETMGGRRPNPNAPTRD